MKKVIAILFVLGLALLHLEVDARRQVFFFLCKLKHKSLLNQLQSNAPGRKLDVASNPAASDIKPNDEHGKSSTYGNPVTGSVPEVEADNDNRISSTSTSSSNNASDDETNSSYGIYGNPSGSSTDTHHVYTNDCNPKKGC
ncbi:hypothetical protein P3X46_008603 [Hevea brasiliensis]|uniref:Uncharacterized protein n=1 Tax=Hevea brasiliensis TaxID=3981 RepID=A0ABQ9ML58_HEVBR|nr:hypothetical protein P3X46_008603 [Hevea brasiliensis]